MKQIIVYMNVLSVFFLLFAAVACYQTDSETDPYLEEGVSRISKDSHIIVCNACATIDGCTIGEVETMFAKEENVHIIQGTYPSLPTGWNHLSPVPFDRSCLLPTPVKPSRTVSTFAGNNETPEKNKKDLLGFLNEKTFCFRTKDGELSSLGKSVYAAEESMTSYSANLQNSDCDVVDAASFMADSELFLSEYWLKQRPVIITNYLTSSVPINDIVQDHEDFIVGVKLSDSSNFEGIEVVADQWKEQAIEQPIPEIILHKIESPDICVVRAAHEQMKLSEAIPLLARNISGISGADANTGSTAYVEYQSLNQRPELLADVFSGRIHDNSNSEVYHMADWLKTLVLGTEAHLWVGDGTTVGKLHFDRPDNILVQLTGSKTFEMLPPGNSHVLREGHMREAMLGSRKQYIGDIRSRASRQVYRKSLEQSTSMVHSPLTIEDAKEQGLVSLTCTVNEGEALFVPSFWWHEVKSAPSATAHKFQQEDYEVEIPLNVAINYWFDPLFDKEFPCVDCKKKFNLDYLNVSGVRGVLERY